jgi:serine/threonine protein kinase
LLKGLESLHRSGVIHRDIKPENIFLSKEGYCKIGDCGLASFADRSARTKTGMIVGTPLYMSPERLGEGQPIPAPQTDIYSAGLIIIRALTGKLPGVRDADIGHKIQFIREVTSQNLKECGLPEALESILFKSVQRDPSLRYSSAAEFLAVFPKDLKEAKVSEIGVKKTTLMVAGKVQGVSTGERRARRIKVPAILATAVIALFLVFLSYCGSDGEMDAKDLNWVREHVTDSPIYTSAFSLIESELLVERLHQFITLEEREWERATRAGLQESHRSVLFNLQSSLEEHRLVQLIMSSLSLNRRNRETDSAIKLIEALQFLKNDCIQSTQHFNSSSVNLYSYILTLAAIRAGRLTGGKRSELLEKAQNYSEVFFSLPESTPSPTLINSIACGRHILFLSRILLRQHVHRDGRSIIAKALSVVRLLPPYTPSSVFNERLFVKTGLAFNERLNFQSVSKVDQLNAIEGLTRESKGRFKIAATLFTSYRSYVKDCMIAKAAKKPSPQPFNERGMYKVFEESAWGLWCSSALDSYSSMRLMDLARVFQAFYLVHMFLATDPATKGAGTDAITGFPKEFTMPALATFYSSTQKELVKHGSSSESQGFIYTHLLDVIRYDYEINYGNLNSALVDFVSSLKKEAPMAYYGVVYLYSKELDVIQPDHSVSTLLLKDLCILAGIPSLDDEFLGNFKLDLPPYWFANAISVLSSRWAQIMDLPEYHKIRLKESLATIRLIDNMKDEIREDGNPAFSERKWGCAKLLLAFALIHRADASLAINKDLSDEIRNSLGRLADDDADSVYQWGQKLLKNKRLSRKELRVNSFSVKGANVF